MASPTPDDYAAGRSFEIRVANAYRALGYQVTHNVELRGKQTDLVARLAPAGAPSITLAVECKDHQAAVGNQIVSDFVATIIRQRSDNAVTSGALVSSSGFTAKGRAAAADYPYVTLLSWEDLTAKVIDVRDQVEQLVARYEQEPIAREYLALNAEQLSWGSLMGKSVGPTPLPSVIADWIERGAEALAPSILFVLGDFGSGKTTLLRHVEYERAKHYVSNQDLHIPLFVTLRNYRDTYDLPQLLKASFRDAYYRDVPSDLLWQRIQEGLFYVLLDGFDEMLDRSDVGRRMELFYALTGVLRSRSPTIVTSRPSYFVAQGELYDALAGLRLEELAITGRRASGYGGASNDADQIRRRLVAGRREVRPSPRAHRPFGAQDVRVARIMSLDREQIERYLNARSRELKTIPVTPSTVIDFIDGTYDLTDLAERPLLLTLIVDSVIAGVLDADDTKTQYGPSGLYEIYTQVKLDLDMSKGRSRREGLSSEARRVLAEAVAIEMYRSRTLEVDLRSTLAQLLADSNIIFERRDLSQAEIVTDFATCSFVTIDDDGKCRFVHKSFRGFFIARVLREGLDHPLTSEWLDREILYFLGGFAPTQPRVSERLWSRYRHSDVGEGTLRRNMLVAYLYTKPEHDSRGIADVDVADCNFSKLSFRGSRHSDVNWREVEIGKLEGDGGRWERVGFEDCRIGTMGFRDSTMSMAFHNSVIDLTSFEHVNGEVEITGCTVRECVLRDSSFVLRDHEGGIEQLTVENGRLDYAQSRRQGTAEIQLNGSNVVLSGCSTSAVSAVDCVVRLEPDCAGSESWVIERCGVLARSRDGGNDDVGWLRVSDIDPETVVLSEAPADYGRLERLPCGLFGEVGALSVDQLIRKLPATWGCVYVDSSGSSFDDEMERSLGEALPRPFVHGSLVIADKVWYSEATVAGGCLSGIEELAKICTHGAWEGRDIIPSGHLTCVLRRIRDQHGSLVEAQWPIFHVFVRERLKSKRKKR